MWLYHKRAIRVACKDLCPGLQSERRKAKIAINFAESMLGLRVLLLEQNIKKKEGKITLDDF